VATFSNCTITAAATGDNLRATDAADGIHVTSNGFNVTASTPSAVVFTTQPSPQGFANDALNTQPQVSIEDQYGNVVTTDSTSKVTLSITPGTGTTGATLNCNPVAGDAANQVTAAKGIATWSGCTINEAGNGYTLTAKDNTDAGTPTTASDAINVLQPPTNLVFHQQPQPTNIVAGSNFTPDIDVWVENGAGLMTTDQTTQVTISVTTGKGPGAITCDNNAVTVVNGAADFTNCSVTAAANGYTLTATDTADNLSVTSNPFNVTAGPVSQIVWPANTPGNGVSGTALSPTPSVFLEDQYGNVVTTDSTSTVTLSTTPGTGFSNPACTSGLQVTASKGIATWTGCTINDAGNGYQLRATMANPNPPPNHLIADSAPFNIAPSQLVYHQEPTSIQAGSNFNPQIVIWAENADGTLAGDFNQVTISVTTGTGPGAIACQHNTIQLNNGVGTFNNCTITAAGAYTLTANDPSDNLNVTSSTFNVTAGAANKIVFPANTPSNGTSGTALAPTPTVSIEDQYGNLLTNSTSKVTLSITLGSGTGTLTCAPPGLQVSANGGIATWTGCTINKPGNNYTLTATDNTDAGHPFGVSAKFKQ